MIRYFDTSALVPYYRPEPLSAACEALLLNSAEGVLVSDLTGVEFASVLARLVRTGELFDDDARRVHAAFSQDLSNGAFLPAKLSAGDSQRARDWLLLRTTGLRTLDALHLACAAGAKAELVTADGLMAKAASILAVPCHFVMG